MKEVPIFIASSIREFEWERKRLSEHFDTLNRIHKESGAELVWDRPETMSQAFFLDGSQNRYDEKIRECRFFVLIIGKRAGQYTEHEFDIALERLKKTRETPVILPFFLNVPSDDSVKAFIGRLKSYGHYVNLYDNFDAILTQLHIELQRYGAFIGDAEPSAVETAARKGLDGIRGLIQERKDKIATLNAQPESWENVQEIAKLYGEIRRLVQEYKIEPDALWDYMVFLYQQHLYDTAIDIGKWLESFYQLGDADEATLAALKNNLGIFYTESNRHTKAEQYHKEALEIRRRLAKENPAAFEPDLATACYNLGLFEIQRKNYGAAKQYFEEALSLYEKFPYLAKYAQDCRDALAFLDAQQSP